MKIILIRYGELTLKGSNRKEFERTLYNNIRRQLEDYDVSFNKDRNRIYVEVNEINEYEEIKSALKKVPGVSSFSIATRAELDIEDIKKTAVDNFDQTITSFKVETKRSNKDFHLTSQEISRSVGGAILNAYDTKVKVDLHNYDSLVRVEIQKDYAYVFTEVVRGLGGLPLGSSGRGAVLLSGGIDSPVAAIEAMKRGLKISCIHFSSPPYTNEDSFKKVLDLVSVLHQYDKDIKLYDVNVADIQIELHKHTDERYSVTLLRRMMFRSATHIARQIKANVLITGESLGQVASQTIENMTATHDATDMLIIQPLITLDKVDIIDKARKYGTYEISIRPFEDCCVIFVAKNPVIKPKLQAVIDEENKIDFQSFLDDCKIKKYNYDIINTETKVIDKFL